MLAQSIKAKYDWLIPVMSRNYLLHCVTLFLMGQANECLLNFFQAIGLLDTKNINCGKEQESGKFDSLQVKNRKAISSHDYARHARTM